MRTTCPECQKVIESDDLKALTRHVKTCGKKTKVKGDRMPARSDRVVPPLPLVLSVTRKQCSQNDYKSNDHWFYTKDAKGWLQHLTPYVLQTSLRGLYLPWSKWSITRVYRKPQRHFDYGNLVGGAKPIPDALITLGVITDDNPDCFSCEYSQRPATADDSADLNTIITLIEARL